MAGAEVQFEKSDEFQNNLGSITLIRVGSFYFNDFRSQNRSFLDLDHVNDDDNEEEHDREDDNLTHGDHSSLGGEDHGEGE